MLPNPFKDFETDGSIFLYYFMAFVITFMIIILLAGWR